MQLFPIVFQTPMFRRVKKNRKYFQCEIENTFKWKEEVWTVTANTAGGRRHDMKSVQ